MVMKSMKSLSERFNLSPSTISSVRRLQTRLHRISKVISNSNNVLELLSAKIKYHNELISKLQEEALAITEHIALKKGTSLSGESSTPVIKTEPVIVILDDETNCSLNSEPPWDEAALESLNLLLMSPEPTDTVDLLCYETLSPSPELSTDLRSTWNGYVETQESGNLVELMNNIPMPISKSPELSGGMDTYWNDLLFSTTSEDWELI
jgi:hypothetical protein